MKTFQISWSSLDNTFGEIKKVKAFFKFGAERKVRKMQKVRINILSTKKV